MIAHTDGAGGYYFPKCRREPIPSRLLNRASASFAFRPGVRVGRIAADDRRGAQGGRCHATFVEAPAVACKAGGGRRGAVDAKSLTSAPLLGNEAASMAVLATGTTSTGSVAGAMSDQNRYLLDGGSNTDDMSAATASLRRELRWLGRHPDQRQPAGVVPTSTESVEQVRPPARPVGRSTNALGGTVQMVTKRGTNQYHGVAYGSYFGSNWGGANSWANNHTPVETARYCPTLRCPSPTAAVSAAPWAAFCCPRCWAARRTSS